MLDNMKKEHVTWLTIWVYFCIPAMPPGFVSPSQRGFCFSRNLTRPTTVYWGSYETLKRWRVAEWIRRRTTDSRVRGSNPVQESANHFFVGTLASLVIPCY